VVEFIKQKVGKVTEFLPPGERPKIEATRIRLEPRVKTRNMKKGRKEEFLHQKGNSAHRKTRGSEEAKLDIDKKRQD